MEHRGPIVDDVKLISGGGMPIVSQNFSGLVFSEASVLHQEGDDIDEILVPEFRVGQALGFRLKGVESVVDQIPAFRGVLQVRGRGDHTDPQNQAKGEQG